MPLLLQMRGAQSLVAVSTSEQAASVLHVQHPRQFHHTPNVQQQRCRTVRVNDSAVLAPAPIPASLPPLNAPKLRPMPRQVEGVADDSTLANPLQRQLRLSTGWFGVIMEYEGVLVESSDNQHQQAWIEVAQELGYPRPLGQLFRRIKGLKDTVVCTRVFCWTQNPSVAAKIAARKAVLYEELLGQRQPAQMLEARPFLETLKRYDIPIAVACGLPEKKVNEGLQRHNLAQYFDSVVAAEDSGAPEVEFTLAYAAQQIARPPARCVVIGDSTASVETAHELGMKCIVISGVQPIFNFASADLVVRHLTDLKFVNMKNLFSNEELVSTEAEPEMEMERDPEFDSYDDDY